MVALPSHSVSLPSHDCFNLSASLHLYFKSILPVCKSWLGRRNTVSFTLEDTFKKKIFLIGEQLLYNIALVSAADRHESAIGICKSSPSWTALPFPTPLGSYKPLVWVTQQIRGDIFKKWSWFSAVAALTHLSFELRPVSWVEAWF